MGILASSREVGSLLIWSRKAANLKVTGHVALSPKVMPAIAWHLIETKRRSPRCWRARLFRELKGTESAHDGAATWYAAPIGLDVSILGLVISTDGWPALQKILRPWRNPTLFDLQLRHVADKGQHTRLVKYRHHGRSLVDYDGGTQTRQPSRKRPQIHRFMTETAERNWMRDERMHGFVYAPQTDSYLQNDELLSSFNFHGVVAEDSSILGQSS